MVCICDACAGKAKHIVIYDVLETQENVYETFYYEHDMHSTTQTGYPTPK